MSKFPEEGSVKDVLDHIDHVGIGTDFGGGGVEGCNDVSEMQRITEGIVRRGSSEEKTENIWGGDVIRVFCKVIETAKSIN